MPLEALHHAGANVTICHRFRPRRVRLTRKALPSLITMGANVRHGEHARVIR